MNKRTNSKIHKKYNTAKINVAHKSIQMIEKENSAQAS